MQEKGDAAKHNELKHKIANIWLCYSKKYVDRKVYTTFRADALFPVIDAKNGKKQPRPYCARFDHPMANGFDFLVTAVRERNTRQRYRAVASLFFS